MPQSVKDALPDITCLGRTENEQGFGVTHYRLVGGCISEPWRARPGHEAWCEIGLWDNSEHLGSFGGEVWPGAWPVLFEAINARPGGYRVTEQGRALLRAVPGLRS